MSVLVPDPLHAYGPAIVRAVLEQGHRVVALHRAEPSSRGVARALRGDAERVVHETCGDDLARTVVALVGRHDVSAVAAADETMFEVAALAATQGVGAMSAAAWRRAADKVAIRERLGAAGVPIPRHVSWTVGEAVPSIAALGWERVVAKPFDGTDSRDVGIFDASDRAGLCAHLSRGGSERWVLEEFIEGPVLSINGQVDSHGAAHTLAVFENARRRPPFEEYYGHQWSIAADDPRVGALVDVAASTTAALDLAGVPFHYEVKDTPAGPLVIDVGARLPGDDLAFVVDRLHGGRVRTVDLAVAGWMGEACVPPVSLADAPRGARTLRVYGLEETGGRVWSVAGHRSVEAHPGFAAWARMPRIGHRVHPTTDLASVPWAVDFWFEAGRFCDDEIVSFCERELALERSPSVAQRLRTVAAIARRRLGRH